MAYLTLILLMEVFRHYLSHEVENPLSPMIPFVPSKTFIEGSDEKTLSRQIAPFMFVKLVMFFFLKKINIVLLLSYDLTSVLFPQIFILKFSNKEGE